MLYSQVQLAGTHKKISNPFVRSLVLIEGTISKSIPAPAWGIDPGVNFGLTFIEKKKVFVFHGALIQDQTPGRYGLIAYSFLQSIIASYSRPNAMLVIEGAAYGAKTSWQAGLAEIRTAFYLAASTYRTPIMDAFEAENVFTDVIVRPPASIRKAVFNDGKVQAGDEWPTINHNAADSLSVALYAAQKILDRSDK